MKNVKTLVWGLCFLGLFGTFSTLVYAVAFFPPTVTTSVVSDIAATTATGNGNITGLGNPNPTAYGVCWNTTGSPTISDSKVNKGAASSTGAFTAAMTGLTASTTYYVRAYATNNTGTNYGSQVTFTTLGPTPTAVAPSGGGTSNNPYVIANVNNLYWLSQNSSEWNKYYIQTADIDASGTVNLDSGNGFTPIGNNSNSFEGTYDGQRHTISGLRINRAATNDIGLFGYINSGIVCNLGLVGGSITGGQCVGGLSGNNAYATIRDCFSTAAVSGSFYVGGLVGYNVGAEINTCYATGNVTATGSNSHFGGLVGFNFHQARINDSYATGTVSASGNDCVGGLVGYNDDDSAINRSFATGAVTGGNCVGGLVGINYRSSDIADCFALGNVTATCYCGGLVGGNYVSSTVSKSYSIGTVSGNASGGLIGDSVVINNNSFYNVTTAGQNDNTGKGVPAVTADMKTLGTFTGAGWDFVSETNNGSDDVWAMESSINNGYPCLAWQRLPYLWTQNVTGISATGATGNINILALGVANPTAYGVCWSTAGTPTISDSKTNEGTASATGEFTTTITGLAGSTTYHVRAYATNTAGTSYGDEVLFTTSASPVPTVTTSAVSSIESTQATGNGNITSLGSPNPTAHGVCWNTTGTPTISDSKTDEGAVSATGEFTTTITGLAGSTTYHVRAYATNTAGTSYGGEVSFTTEDPVYPEVTTISGALVSATEFIAGGDVEDNGEDLIAVGLCWNTTGTPTISDSKTDEGTDEDDFASNVMGLTKGVTYYYRAYATNAHGTVYGEEKTITMMDLPYTWAEVQPAGGVNQLWVCNAISSNGKIMLAGCMDGRMYLSKDSGSTWAEVQPAGNNDHQWYDLAMSADGSVMVAITMDSSYVYLSKDSGITWTAAQPVSGVQGWLSGGISADGKVIYVSTDSKLGLSTDSGTTWSELNCAQPTGNGWYCSDVSPDGKNLMAGDTYGKLYLSHDTGTHWAEIQPAGDTTSGWMSATFSSDGTMILVGNQEGGLYLSKNSGSSWSSVLPAGDMAVWFGEAMSRNGSKMVLSGYLGCIYASTDSGTTWIKMAPNKKYKGEWARISMSVDGSKVLVGEIGGRLYVGTTTTSSTAMTDDNGGAVVANDVINAAVSGFNRELPVEIKEGDNGSQQLTIGQTGSLRLAATISGASAGTTVTASTNEGDDQDTIEIALPSGRKIKVILVQFPDGSNVGLDLGNEEILSSVTNASGSAINLDIQAVDNGGDITFIVTYHAPASNPNAKTVWTAPGGSVTITAEGLNDSHVYKITLNYANVSLGDAAESDLRLLRVVDDAALTAAGSNDCGDVSATDTLGDYGVTTATKQVWANVSTLGTFAVGVPEEKQVTEVVTTTTSYLCPVMGPLVCLFMIMNFVGLAIVRSKGNV
jgi:photosystem II stability/assembly factor-like uncharacterized protein